MKTTAASLLLGASLLLSSLTAHAAEEPSPPPSPNVGVAAKDVRLEASTGVFVDGGGSLGGTVGVTGLRRVGAFEYGLDVNVGNRLWGYSFGQAEAAGGVVWQSPSGLRLDAIGELGATYYHGAGQDLFDDNPGRNGFTPTVRAKAGISYAFAPRAPSHFVLGLWGTGEDDLTRDTKAVTFQQHDLFGGGSEQTTERDTIGTARVGAVVSLGAAF